MARRRDVEEIHYCRECEHCTEVCEPENLLSVKKKPILGRCPYWTESRSVLLSQRSCGKFKPKIR